MDEQNALRYIALAKVYRQTNKLKQTVEALENAVKLEKNAVNYKLLSEAYLSTGDTVKANRYMGISKRLKIKEDQKRAQSRKDKKDSRNTRSGRRILKSSRDTRRGPKRPNVSG